MNNKGLVSLITIILMVAACSGPQYPFDSGYQDSADLAQEFAEGRLEAEQYDKYLEDKYKKFQDEAQREMEYDERSKEFDDRIDEMFEDAGWTSGSGSGSISSGEGCPNGCTTHKSSCDIKGNISYNTKEKIYHVPGRNFYNETEINPNKGERLFCSEAEARANGWRKAKN